MKLAYKISELKAAEGDIIYENDNIDANLYFIRRGSVKLQIEGSILGE